MSRGMPSMTALLGLLAIAGYQNRDKLAEMLREHGANNSNPSAGTAPQAGLGGLLSNLSGVLGGAGAVETAACALSIRDGVIPPTINLENPDPECDLDYTANTAKQKKVRIAVNNSFGFGGHNATLVTAEYGG